MGKFCNGWQYEDQQWAGPHDPLHTQLTVGANGMFLYPLLTDVWWTVKTIQVTYALRTFDFSKV
jgi:hypothetical protein